MLKGRKQIVQSRPRTPLRCSVCLDCSHAANELALKGDRGEWHSELFDSKERQFSDSHLSDVRTDLRLRVLGLKKPCQILGLVPIGTSLYELGGILCKVHPVQRLGNRRNQTDRASDRDDDVTRINDVARNFGLDLGL